MIFRMPAGEELTIEKLSEFITEAKKMNEDRFQGLKDAYRSQYPILTQEEKPKYKPDNRLVVNFAKYIVDTFNGFFIGNPIKTTCDEPKIAEFVEFVESYNDQDDNNAELAKLTSVYGRAYEMYFVDDDGNLGITYLDPTQSFMIYDDGILEKPLFFVHWYVGSDDVERGSVSDAQNVYYFAAPDGEYVWQDKPVIHGFAGVPATEFIENDERIGIFEPCLTLINEYNKALSEKANDVDYFADAYMKILGPKLEEADLKALRDQRIINLEGQLDGTLVVEFMEKPNADTTQENLLNKLERLIYQISMVPNLNDEAFGTASGIAMQYKLLNTTNLFKAKQRKFESGMNRRWKIIFSNVLIHSKVAPDDWAKLRYRFTPNVPANALEEAQTAAQLTGLVSHRTQLEMLSMVNNVDQELDRIESEDAESFAGTSPAFDSHKDEDELNE